MDASRALLWFAVGIVTAARGGLGVTGPKMHKVSNPASTAGRDGALVSSVASLKPPSLRRNRHRAHVPIACGRFAARAAWGPWVPRTSRDLC